MSRSLRAAAPLALLLLLAGCGAQPRAARGPGDLVHAAASEPPAAAASRPPGAATAATAPADTASAEAVERVIDGDTLVLAGGETVRVLGIDTAEMTHPDARVRACALEARRQLEALVGGRRVALGGMPRPPRDRYGRLLAYVEVAGIDAGARLVERGLALPYPSAHPRAAAYRDLAFAARRRGDGLWSRDVAGILELSPERDVTAADAGAHEGRLVRLRGTLEAGRRAPRIHVARLRDASGALDVVIFPSRYDEIPPDLVTAWSRGEVEVTGRISRHEGRPQVILDDPFMVEPCSR